MDTWAGPELLCKDMQTFSTESKRKMLGAVTKNPLQQMYMKTISDISMTKYSTPNQLKS